MCLAIPGELVELFERDSLPMGRVSFNGSIREACLLHVPEARPGDFLLVHVGFALSCIDAVAAQEVFQMLEELGAAGEEHS